MTAILIPVISVLGTLALVAIGIFTFRHTFAGQGYSDRRYENTLRLANEEAAALNNRVETLRAEHQECFNRLSALEQAIETLKGTLVREVVAEIVRGVREELHAS